jgi:hypothetical protein
MMSSWSKVIRNATRGREKTLCVTDGFEATHRSLSLPRWLKRVFCSIAQAFVLAMFDAGYDFFLGGGITGQFVRDAHAWHIYQLFKQLAKKLLRSLFVAPPPLGKMEWYHGHDEPC